MASEEDPVSMSSSLCCMQATRRVLGGARPAGLPNGEVSDAATLAKASGSGIGLQARAILSGSVLEKILGKVAE